MAESCEDRRLLEMLHRRNEELQTLVQIGKTLTSTLDIEELTNIIIEKANLLFKSRAWSLLFLDEASQELVFDVVVSEVAPQLKGQRLALGQGIAGYVALQRQPLLVADVRRDPRFCAAMDRLTGFPTCSVLCVPVQIQGQLLGVMQLVNGPGDPSFNDNDMQLLATIADYVAIGISNARNFSRVHELVITDDLTGLFNARYFDDLLTTEISRAHRFGEPLSLVFMDLDHFKWVNDRHGHLVGSRMLAEIGQLLKNRIRAVDFGARYGGDEFVLILPQTGKTGAFELVSQLRQRIREHVLLADNGTPVQVTASFGIASLPEDADNKIDLIRLADNRMYRVKETSRDGICLD
ncbi:sensor domain-containing diguanylate cyclase [Desulfuromonas thiophila]|jgi:diguanylate cyclase (GGDEF)-like protein|uniref:diguanylate cyclase n=1 Tax=Desulfuromonas thiophila TaxID=57664 RepID=A0A1G6XSZ4_9BACT|nr:sensor domain-containing diguanylate cyclase [Desulfuromonas thiophila]MDD3800965.1 sensor domain-containing diguanylate cyclase [Desulfuromonas thiophila]MDY0397067.1 sensor domain-containing diguanylate cyclase [Desulfuromonas thiophila]SDD81260.1 diguanylate cyclase with GAF sensor [Desulfuromonas thiophila]